MEIIAMRYVKLIMVLWASIFVTACQHAYDPSVNPHPNNAQTNANIHHTASDELPLVQSQSSLQSHVVANTTTSTPTILRSKIF